MIKGRRRDIPARHTHLAPIALALTVLTGTAAAWDEPKPLDQALNTPDWLHLEFTHRTRFESLWNQFRPVFPGDDRALSLRTTLLTEFRFNRVAMGIEVADSRVYLEDDNTPLDTTLINPLDFLQVYVRADLRDAFTAGANLRITAGRQTMDLGSRRFLARNRFRNTINTFTGLDVEWTGPNGTMGRAFATVPVRKRPDLFDALSGNDIEFDRELTATFFWGLFYGSRPWSGHVRAEAYVLGLEEDDDDGVPTRNRDFLTYGFRLLSKDEPGRFDFELETAVQSGKSRSTVRPDDTTDLDHLSFFVHGAVAYTFDRAWQPRLVLQCDYASGDADPTDGDQGRFDTLFGARRFEYGPTGIWGAFARSNFRSAALRFMAEPHPGLPVMFAYRPGWLAEASDLWTTTRIWDPEGRSGTFLGHQFEGSARWWILPGNLALEGGFAYLRFGYFPKNAPLGALTIDSSTYAYAQLIFQM